MDTGVLVGLLVCLLAARLPCGLRGLPAGWPWLLLSGALFCLLGLPACSPALLAAGCLLVLAVCVSLLACLLLAVCSPACLRAVVVARLCRSWVSIFGSFSLPSILRIGSHADMQSVT